MAKLTNFCTSLIIIGLLATINFAQETNPYFLRKEEPNKSNFVSYVPNRFNIKLDLSKFTQLKENLLEQGILGIEVIDKLNLQNGVTKIKRIFNNTKKVQFKGKNIDLSGWLNITVNSDMDILDIVSKYVNIPGIISVNPIAIHSISTDPPNDPQFINQWHLNQISDFDIDALEGYDINTGNKEIIVAILDTGVRYFHNDLGGSSASPSSPQNTAGNIWINYIEKNGIPGIDDDNNGFIDDWLGWDFVNSVNLIPFFQSKISGEDYNNEDNDPRDFNGHGTHCAGIVASINNNGYSVSSPAGGWGNETLEENSNGVKIMPLRIGYSANFLFQESGFVEMDFAAKALVYAADNGAKIASCSWGSSDNELLKDAIDYFLASGGLIFKAAGNNNDEQSDYMTTREDIVTVASTDQNDIKSSFSTYGTFVDISAPGTDIISTYHVHSDPNNDYSASLSGTSMATPLAASVAALIWSKNPNWNAQQVKIQLFESCDNIYSINENLPFTNKLGAGRVNVFKALTSKSFNATIFLEGAYIGTSLMTNDVAKLYDFPKKQPFNKIPWNYNGNEKVENIPPNIVDWILIKLRDKNNPEIVHFTRAAFLQNNGKIVDLDGSSIVQFPVNKGDYLISIHHRNHLPIMSQTPITIN